MKTHYKVAVSQVCGGGHDCATSAHLCVCEREEVHTYKQNGNLPRSDDIRAIVCVWPRVYDEPSDNNVQRERAVSMCAWLS